MEAKRYRPLVDKLFYIIAIPTLALLVGASVLACFEPSSLFIMIPIDLSCVYFLISPLFGFVELRSDTVFIKFGFFMKKEIPYSKIRKIDKARRIYADSMLSLKNSMVHINIRYNAFDLVSVSVRDNDAFVSELEERIARQKQITP